MTSREGQDGSHEPTRRPALPAVRERAAERAAGRLLLALGGALAIVLAAVPLALLVRAEWPPLADVDAEITRDAEAAVSGSRTLLLVARAATLLGDPVLLWVLVLAAGALLARSGRPRLALFLLAVRLGAQLISSGLKLAVDRARPVFDVPVDEALGAAFPSGHALGAAAVWTALALLLARRSRRTLVVVVTAAVVVAVAASRVLLGVHYLTDVVGGVLLGTGWTAVCAAVFIAQRSEARSGRMTA